MTIRKGSKRVVNWKRGLRKARIKLRKVRRHELRMDKFLELG